MASNGCDAFMAKWAEFNENTEMDPNDIVWTELWQSPSFGLARLGKFGPAASAQQLAANINRFFAENQYAAELTPEESDFIWNLYLRAATPVPADILITCNVLSHIVNTPVDQLTTINWAMFDGGSGGEDSDDDADSNDESNDDFVQPAFPATTFPPSQQLLQPFRQAAPTPALTAAAVSFNPTGTSSLMPGASFTTPLQSPATSAQQAPVAALFQPQPAVPGGLLQGAFGQPAPSPFAATQTTAPAAMHDLPYVTTVIKGLKSSDKSRLLLINIDDDGTGNKLQIGVFITAGEMPTSVVNTTFSTEDYSFKDKDQKSQIHEQNKRSIAAASGLIPFNLSNGTDDKGVCAQLIRGFSVVSEGKMDQDCKPDTNRPRSVKRDAGVATAGPTAFGMATGMPTQPGFGQSVAGPSQFGSQPTSGGFATTPTFGGFAAVATPEIAPPGTRAVQVPDFDKAGTFREAYQIPGGPHPIAVGKKVGVSPGTWFWYQLPNGAVVKSEKRYLGLLDEKSMTKKHGDKQVIRVNEILRMMQGQYGPTFNQVTGPPTSTGPAPPKSSGRGKGKGKTTTPPTSGGLPPGFQPMGSVVQMQATAAPPGGFGQMATQVGFGQAAAPAPAGNTWLEFSSGRRAELKRNQPDLAGADITKILSQEWAAQKAAVATVQPAAGFQSMGSLFPAQAVASPQMGFQAAAPLPAGFGQAMPVMGSTPGVLQQQLAPPASQPLFSMATFGAPQPTTLVAQTTPVAQALFGGQAVVAQQPPASPMAFFGAAQPAPVAFAPPVAQPQPATNPLFAAMMQSQQQTGPLPTGLFSRPGKSGYTGD